MKTLFPVLRLNREFRFEAAHLLPWHEGNCRHLHGHSYRLSLEIRGRLQDQPGNSACDMVMDLKQFKQLVEDTLIKPCDHAVLVPDTLTSQQLEAIRTLSERILLLPFQPTCERLVCWMAEQIDAALPEGIRVVKARLWETAQSSASWDWYDQQTL